DHIRNFNGGLRTEFFDFRVENHAKWSFPACLDFCQPRRWIHAPSGTLEGGMFGIKWPVLWMAFMMVSAKDLGKGKGPEYPDGIVATFTARENGQLESLVALWQQELRSSISKLQETRE